MSKIVICNGGYKTGSTLSFNIVREILVDQGVTPSHPPSFPWSVPSYKETKFWSLLKTHRYIPNEEIDNFRFVHTYRNPLEVTASTLQVDKGNGSFRNHKLFTELFWQKMAKHYHEGRPDTLLLPYRDLYHDLEDCIIRVAEFLELKNVSVDQIAQKLSLINMKKRCNDIPYGEADPDTQLRSDNISSWMGNPDAWKTVLDPSTIDSITQTVGIWTD